MPQPSRHVTARISFRKGTTAEWLASDPVLMSAEPAVDTTENKLKIGNGTDKWSELSYVENFGTDLDASLIDYVTKVSLQSTDDTLRSLIDLRATQADLESTEDALTDLINLRSTKVSLQSTEDALTDLINLRATKVSLQSTEDALTDLINLRATGSYQDFLNGYGNTIPGGGNGGTGGGGTGGGGGTSVQPEGSYVADPYFDLNNFVDAVGAHHFYFLVPYTNTRTGTAIEYPAGTVFRTTGISLDRVQVRAEDPDNPRDFPYTTSASNLSSGVWSWFQVSSRGTQWEFATTGTPADPPSDETFVIADPNVTYDPYDVYSYISEQSLTDAGKSTDAAGYYKLQVSGFNQAQSEQAIWWAKTHNADGTYNSNGWRWAYYTAGSTAISRNLGLSNLSTVDNSNNISRIILFTSDTYEAVFGSSLVSSDRYVTQ
jgi:hypothetical protein